MASTVPSYVSFKAAGSSGHLTQYADGSFLTVWTEFAADGSAYAYGQVFKPDGTTLRDTFLIASASAAEQATYGQITAASLTDGRTVVAWAKNDGSGTSIVGKVLSAGFVPSSETLTLSDPSVPSKDAPQLVARADGGFTVLYSGKLDFEGQTYTAQWASKMTEQNGEWASPHPGSGYWLHLNADDPAIAASVLGNGDYVVIDTFSVDGVNTPLTAQIFNETSSTFESKTLYTISGIASGIHPAITAIGTDKFVAAWEDVDGTGGRVIRAQVFDSGGNAVGAAVTFTKPDGTLEDTPVIKQLANGGFAIAFKLQVGSDDNIYTAAATATGEIIADTTHVGTSTAGDQWDPSLIALSGNTYAVSWMSDSSTGGGFLVEVVGVSGTTTTTPTKPTTPMPPVTPITPIPSSDWFGTNGNDVYAGSSLSEVLKGFGGKDVMSGGAGDDKLFGGLGNDTLSGDAGRDVFVFDTKLGTATTDRKVNFDKIVEFSVKDDSVFLDNAIFKKLGKGSEQNPGKLNKKFFTFDKAKDANDYLIYNKKTGVLSYDADGSGAKAAIEFAQLKKNLKMTYDDFKII